MSGVYLLKCLKVICLLSPFEKLHHSLFCLSILILTFFSSSMFQMRLWHSLHFFPRVYVSDSYYHHHHKHQGLDPLIRSVFRVTTALSNLSSVFQLFSFLVLCSDMISKGFGFVAFFASVKASSVCIYLYCLVCIQSVVDGVPSLLFCGHKGCRLPEVSITSFLPLYSYKSSSLWGCQSPIFWPI